MKLQLATQEFSPISARIEKAKKIQRKLDQEAHVRNDIDKKEIYRLKKVKLDRRPKPRLKRKSIYPKKKVDI